MENAALVNWQDGAGLTPPGPKAGGCRPASTTRFFAKIGVKPTVLILFFYAPLARRALGRRQCGGRHCSQRHVMHLSDERGLGSLNDIPTRTKR